MADRLDNPTNLNKLLNGDTEGLEVLLASRHLDFLKEENVYRKGALNMNFNSPTQLLAFFKIWYPTLGGTGVKELKKLKHPVIESFKSSLKPAS
jgi:hypothetical protein